ncbi:MAG: protease modulator HflC [Pseudomonadota bacterium]
MGASRIGILLAAGIALVIFGACAFTVDEREFALKFKFGQIVRSDYEPGLHFKIPVANNIVKLPKQILTIDNQPEEVITAEKKTVFVDFFLKWRIVEPVKYYVSTGGGREENARFRLTEIIKGSLRSEFAKRTVQEVISVQRTGLMDDMLTAAAETANEIGVELVDLRVKRVEFNPDVQDSVFSRMRQERFRIATDLRSKGKEEAEELKAIADKQRIVIEAEAYREAQKIRGEGDARAAEIYADAYSQDAEFYAFYRSIQAYKNSLGRTGDLLVIEPDSDFLRYLNDSQGRQ